MRLVAVSSPINTDSPTSRNKRSAPQRKTSCSCIQVQEVWSVDRAIPPNRRESESDPQVLAVFVPRPTGDAQKVPAPEGYTTVDSSRR
ncbi:MAG: hypothetical protein PHY23_10500 [Oscillospiraceae bacterium]|nr:hypothetical protein [Oscillospiraceae bacterium]